MPQTLIADLEVIGQIQFLQGHWGALFFCTLYPFGLCCDIEESELFQVVSWLSFYTHTNI